MRQGGILSPDLYNIYVNDLICKLRKSKIGCHISEIFAAALFYADDMCRLRTEILCIGAASARKEGKTKRLALMIVIVKTARSTKENK